MNVDEFVKQIESKFKLKVIDFEFHVEDGWNPLIVIMTNKMMSKFKNKFVPPSEFMGVKYYIQGDKVYFFSKVGNQIENILRSI